MKTVREVIRRTPVWVNPEHTIESAIVLMRGHKIGALPVLDGMHLVGMVLYSHLLGADPQLHVGDIMATSFVPVGPDTPVREAAKTISLTGMGCLPVVDGERLIGAITDGDLLLELGRSYDPLTQLPWADSLREWAIDQLKRGHEITVLFLDLDHFGLFNKLYGHLVGDEVLKRVSACLSEVTDTDCDYLCRYGGDEFCIASLRSAGDATDLGERITRQISRIDISSVRGERIAGTLGQCGGKRTREREQTHYAATLNSLINLASRDCMARKAGRPDRLDPTEILAPAAARDMRIRLARVDVTTCDKSTTVQIVLRRGADPLASAAGTWSGVQGTLLLEGITEYTSTVSAEVEERGIPKLVAEATAASLRTILPEGYDITLSDVLVTKAAQKQDVITVVGQFVAKTQTIPIAGSVLIARDPYRAASSAVLASVNRLLGLIPVKSRA